MVPIILIIMGGIFIEPISQLTGSMKPFIELIPYACWIILSIVVLFILWEIIKDINEIREYINISTQTDGLSDESSTQTDYIMEFTEPWPESTEPWPESTKSNNIIKCNKSDISFIID